MSIFRHAIYQREEIKDVSHPVFNPLYLMNSNLSGRYFIRDLSKFTSVFATEVEKAELLKGAGILDVRYSIEYKDTKDVFGSVDKKIVFLNRRAFDNLDIPTGEYIYSNTIRSWGNKYFIPPEEHHPFSGPEVETQVRDELPKSIMNTKVITVFYTLYTFEGDRLEAKVKYNDTDTNFIHTSIDFLNPQEEIPSFVYSRYKERSDNNFYKNIEEPWTFAKMKGKLIKGKYIYGAFLYFAYDKRLYYDGQYIFGEMGYQYTLDYLKNPVLMESPNPEEDYYKEFTRLNSFTLGSYYKPEEHVGLPFYDNSIISYAHLQALIYPKDKTKHYDKNSKGKDTRITGLSENVGLVYDYKMYYDYYLKYQNLRMKILFRSPNKPFKIGKSKLSLNSEKYYQEIATIRKEFIDDILDDSFYYEDNNAPEPKVSNKAKDFTNFSFKNVITRAFYYSRPSKEYAGQPDMEVDGKTWNAIVDPNAFIEGTDVEYGLDKKVFGGELFTLYYRGLASMRDLFYMRVPNYPEYANILRIPPQFMKSYINNIKDLTYEQLWSKESGLGDVDGWNIHHEDSASILLPSSVKMTRNYERVPYTEEQAAMRFMGYNYYLESDEESASARSLYYFAHEPVGNVNFDYAVESSDWWEISLRAADERTKVFNRYAMHQDATTIKTSWNFSSSTALLNNFSNENDYTGMEWKNANTINIESNSNFLIRSRRGFIEYQDQENGTDIMESRDTEVPDINPEIREPLPSDPKLKEFTSKVHEALSSGVPKNEDLKLYFKLFWSSPYRDYYRMGRYGWYYSPQSKFVRQRPHFRLELKSRRESLKFDYRSQGTYEYSETPAAKTFYRNERLDKFEHKTRITSDVKITNTSQRAIGYWYLYRTDNNYSKYRIARQNDVNAPTIKVYDYPGNFWWTESALNYFSNEYKANLFSKLGSEFYPVLPNKKEQMEIIDYRFIPFREEKIQRSIHLYPSVFRKTSYFTNISQKRLELPALYYHNIPADAKWGGVENPKVSGNYKYLEKYLDESNFTPLNKGFPLDNGLTIFGHPFGFNVYYQREDTPSFGKYLDNSLAGATLVRTPISNGFIYNPEKD